MQQSKLGEKHYDDDLWWWWFITRFNSQLFKLICLIRAVCLWIHKSWMEVAWLNRHTTPQLSSCFAQSRLVHRNLWHHFVPNWAMPISNQWEKHRHRKEIQKNKCFNINHHFSIKACVHVGAHWEKLTGKHNSGSLKAS